MDIETTLYKTKLDARGRAISSERVSNLTDGAHKMREEKAGEEARYTHHIMPARFICTLPHETNPPPEERSLNPGSESGLGD